MKRKFENIKNWKWGRIVILLSCIALTIAFIKIDAILFSLSDTFKSIIEMPRLFHCIVGISMVISVLHLVYVPKGGIAKEHLLYKRLGPILSVPLTAITHGIFFYCGLLINYIFLYDDNTVMKYTNLDRTTVAITMLSLMTYAIYSMALIIGDICNPKEVQRTGTLVDENAENTNAENSQETIEDNQA